METKGLWNKVKESLKEKVSEYAPKSTKAGSPINEKSYVHGTSAGEMPDVNATKNPSSQSDAQEAFQSKQV